MERDAWLRKVRAQAEALYDHFAPAYWARYGQEPAETHRRFIDRFLGRLPEQGRILDAACGAGLYDGMLVAAGHSVLGIDQSAGMLARAREHYPEERYPSIRYAKIGLQEMDFRAEFDGAICMDAVEHICPEDWPVILGRLQAALKPGGVLYVTADPAELGEYGENYERARAMGLPVVYGEVVDRLDELYVRATALSPLDPQGLSGDDLDQTVYHYHPSMPQVRAWYARAGLTIEAEATGDWYWHILAAKNA
jgi:2-polyprenyl-3-methyl-5-hydroxy-6-metoxy-1,4-benzoquinol methylase